eukprot:3984126-Alexandrium_andersonii.AAC.1
MLPGTIARDLERHLSKTCSGRCSSKVYRSCHNACSNHARHWSGKHTMPLIQPTHATRRRLVCDGGNPQPNGLNIAGSPCDNAILARRTHGCKKQAQCMRNAVGEHTMPGNAQECNCYTCAWNMWPVAVANRPPLQGRLDCPRD